MAKGYRAARRPLFCSARRWRLRRRSSTRASCGHDFDFHLVSWIDALQLAAWHFLSALDATPNYGAGEPRFIFYPPLTWMLGAALGAILPWRAVPLVTDVSPAGRDGSRHARPGPAGLNDGPATLAGCFAIFSGYALFTVYERSAYAEMSGGFWMPLLLLLILRQNEQKLRAPSFRFLSVERVGDHHSRQYPSLEFHRTTLLLRSSSAGAWLSNAPLGVMLSYLLAAVSVCVALLARSWLPVLRAAVAAVLGLGLSAFFWIPAAWEQHWVAIRQAIDDPGLLIENSLLFARHADPRLELHDIELIRVSGIAVTMAAVALGGLAVGWRRRALPGRRWWLPLAMIPVAVLLLQLPISLPSGLRCPRCAFCSSRGDGWWCSKRPWASSLPRRFGLARRRWRVLVAALCGAVSSALPGLPGLVLPELRRRRRGQRHAARLPRRAPASRAPTSMRRRMRTTRLFLPVSRSRAW